MILSMAQKWASHWGTVISDTLGYTSDQGYRAFLEGGFGVV